MNQSDFVAKSSSISYIKSSPKPADPKKNMGPIVGEDQTNLMQIYGNFTIWLFPKIGVPPNHPF